MALDVGLDTTTPAGGLVAAALAMAARFEYRRISERQREKHDQLRRLGRARGREATPRKIADRIVRLRDRGASWQAIADQFERDKVPTPRGGTAWRPSSVRSAYLTRQRELAAQAARPATSAERAPKYTLHKMAMEYAVQRLEMGDVVLINLPEQEEEVEAKVVRPIDRTERTVRVLLRAEGRADFVREWPLGELVTVVRGP